MDVDEIAELRVESVDNTMKVDVVDGSVDDVEDIVELVDNPTSKIEKKDSVS